MISELVFHSPLGACEGHQRNSFVTPCECIRRHATSPLPTMPLAPLHSRHHRFPHRSTQNGANLLSCCFMACFLPSAVTFLTAAFIFDISDFDSTVACSIQRQCLCGELLDLLTGVLGRSFSCREYHHAFCWFSILHFVWPSDHLRSEKQKIFPRLLYSSLSARRDPSRYST